MGFFSSLVGGVVGFLVGGPVGAVIGAGIGATKVGEKIVNTALDFIVQPFMGLLGGVPKIDAGSETTRQQGVLVSRPGGSDENIPVVYGLRKVGGIITFAETGPITGTPANRYLWVAYVFSEGPVEGLYELYIDDNQLDGSIIADLNAGREVSISTGKYAGRVVMRWSPGVYFADVQSSTLGATVKNGVFSGAPSFKVSHYYNGLATLFVRYEWKEIKTQADSDANPFGGSIPGVQAVIMGRKVAPLFWPVGVAITQFIPYESSIYYERYSTNPAEILLDYLRNPRYGKGLRNGEIDWTSFSIAASKCNQQVTYTNTNITGPIMTCNTVLDTSATLFQNVKNLLQGFRAYMPYVQGRYKLKIEDAGNETDILSGSATIVAECVSTYETIAPGVNNGVNLYEIMGDVVYTGIDRSNKYNQVVVKYVNPNQEYKWSVQEAIYPATETDRQVFVAQDGGRENKLEATFYTITNYAMAADFAKILFNKSRYSETATLRVSSQAFELEPGDNIRIRARTLAFGDVPWRVIGIQHNGDCTFNITAVRNPDFLFPYTRIGEPDVVRPLYVPKGTSVYYPASTTRPDLSLIPPTNAVNNGLPGTVLNPAPTVPTANTGGGVGSNVGSINTTQINNTPTGAPVIQPLTDVIDVTNIQYVNNSGIVYARLTVRQPQHAQFDGINFYINLSGSTGYVLQQDRTKPGAGLSYSVDVGPLAVISSLQAASNNYTVLIRVFYSTGESSTQFTSLTLNPATQALAGTNPSETVQSAATAWPSLVIAQPAGRDTRVDICRVLVPAPQANVRTARVELSQDVRTQTLNPDVTGVNIYARSDAQQFWTRTSYAFANYSPGSVTSFDYAGYLGVKGTGVDQNGIIPGGGAVYTFVFRLTYRDGTESSQQFVATGKVETPQYSTAANVNIFYGVGVATDSTVSRTGYMTTGDLAIDLEPPTSANTALGIQMSVNSISTSTAGGVDVVMWAPTSQIDRWQGVRMRYRPVVPGQNPAFQSQDFTSSTDISTQPSLANANIRVTPTYRITSMVQDTYYQLVLTPLVFAGGRNFQEANTSTYGLGLVSLNNAPATLTGSGRPNWAASWNFGQMDTGIATNSLVKTIDSANPVASVTFCTGYRVPRDTVQENIGYLRLRDFIRLRYDCTTVTGFQELRIYRRAKIKNPVGGTSEARYYGIGRWELVTVTASSGTVSLRMPTSPTEFDINFGLPNQTGRTLTRGMQTSSTSTSLPTGVVDTTTRYLVPVHTNHADVEILLIVRALGQVSNTAVYLRGTTLATNQQANYLTTPPVIFPYQDATNTTATWIRDAAFPDVNGVNYLRRISDARAPIDIAYLGVQDPESLLWGSGQDTTAARILTGPLPSAGGGETTV